ncbi:MAG: hypothetical protein H7X86_13000, partial [Gorillibacterium sp.]|nr:hypothetical protein [Gorillibacterium sp.]
DTYFGAWMAALDNKELAYSNAIEITREKTPAGFVPNAIWGAGFKTLDRSQPPVGSLAVMELYRRFGDVWLLEELFPSLLEWNTWFYEHRQIRKGLLAWGSNPYEPAYGNHWETAGVGSTYGGALESGLDNSPMYDEIPVDPDTHCLQLADVGLMSLYIADCQALRDMALTLGKNREAETLAQRANSIHQGLQSLWDEETGMFLNKRTDTDTFTYRLSPTHFYPLLCRAASDQQAERMIKEHLLNPEEFWGDWILPSIARNDPAYPDQEYWRGRIWAPMNFLVYLGLRNYPFSEVRSEFAGKSVALLLKEWREHRHVHENYCADTGVGCDSMSSDKFYHWGALLALIGLME